MSATVFAQVAGRYEACFVPGTWEAGDLIEIGNHDEVRRLEQITGALDEQRSRKPC